MRVQPRQWPASRPAVVSPKWLPHKLEKAIALCTAARVAAPAACASAPTGHTPLGVQRMGQGPRQEGSEEVRLQLARLLICLLRPPDASQHTIQQQLPDLVAATCSAVADASPDIKRVRLPMCHMLCHSARLCAGSLRPWAQVASSASATTPVGSMGVQGGSAGVAAAFVALVGQHIQRLGWSQPY